MTAAAKIALVMSDLAAEGISKDQVNKFDKYKFRGIDDVYNSLSRILSHHGLVLVPTLVSHDVEVVETSTGKNTRHATVVMSYQLIDSEDPDHSGLYATVVGEGQDRGDKALNKALSAAYKLMAFQLFCIPTEGQSIDSESESPEVPVQLISRKQLDEITRLLLASNTDPVAFCEWQQIAVLTDLPASRYDNVIGALQRKIQRLGEEYAKEQDDTARSEGEQK